MRPLTGGAVLSSVFTVLIVVSFWDPARYRLPGDERGYEPVQPIPYSHKVHAGEYGIPCEFCHYAASKSRTAGVPDAATCMKCHTQVLKDSPELRKISTALATRTPIQWVRVTDLPDFVQFDHSRHVQKGVTCQTCHGPIQTMERVRQETKMTMGWCIACHRDYTTDPPPELAPVHASVDCSVCHY